MIVAWAFAFLIEEPAGLATPAAIARSYLSEFTAFLQLRVALCCLS